MISLFILLLFFCTLLSFLIQRRSILSALLSLEAMILLSIFQSVSFVDASPAFVIFILIIAACESAFGLTILVLVSRSEETDKLFFLSC